MPKQGVGPFQFTGSIGEDSNPLFTLNLRLERASQTTELSEIFKMLVTDPFVAQGLHTQIDLIISLSWASGSGSHSPASTT